MKTLLEFFQEDNGGMSMTRLLVFFGLVNVIFVWDVAALVAVLRGQPLPDIPVVVAGIVTGLLALKFGQKTVEQKGQP